MSASVNLPLHHKVQKIFSGTTSPGWSQKKGRKMVVVVIAILTKQFFTARRNACIASAVLARQFRPSVCPSVRPSVCHTPVLCQNDGT